MVVVAAAEVEEVDHNEVGQGSVEVAAAVEVGVDLVRKYAAAAVAVAVAAVAAAPTRCGRQKMNDGGGAGRSSFPRTKKVAVAFSEVCYFGARRASEICRPPQLLVWYRRHQNRP